MHAPPPATAGLRLARTGRLALLLAGLAAGAA